MGRRIPEVAGSQRPPRLRVVESYAHRDERLREELDKHLSPLRRSQLIETWYDRRIIPGTALDAEIDKHLSTADIILLLISPDFINSDYCYQTELQKALKRHARRQARVIPIILRPVDWKGTPIAGLLAAPRDAKPVTTWQRRDDAFFDVAKSVRKAAEDIIALRTTSTATPSHLSRRARKNPARAPRQQAHSLGTERPNG